MFFLAAIMTIDDNLVCSFHVLRPSELKELEKNKNLQNKKVSLFILLL